MCHFTLLSILTNRPLNNKKHPYYPCTDGLDLPVRSSITEKTSTEDPNFCDFVTNNIILPSSNWLKKLLSFSSPSCLLYSSLWCFGYTVSRPFSKTEDFWLALLFSSRWWSQNSISLLSHKYVLFFPSVPYLTYHSLLCVFLLISGTKSSKNKKIKAWLKNLGDGSKI